MENPNENNLFAELTSLGLNSGRVVVEVTHVYKEDRLYSIYDEIGKISKTSVILTHLDRKGTIDSEDIVNSLYYFGEKTLDINKFKYIERSRVSDFTLRGAIAYITREISILDGNIDYSDLLSKFLRRSLLSVKHNESIQESSSRIIIDGSVVKEEKASGDKHYN